MSPRPALQISLDSCASLLGSLWLSLSGSQQWLSESFVHSNLLRIFCITKFFLGHPLHLQCSFVQDDVYTRQSFCITFLHGDEDFAKSLLLTPCNSLVSSDIYHRRRQRFHLLVAYLHSCSPLAPCLNVRYLLNLLTCLLV